MTLSDAELDQLIIDLRLGQPRRGGSKRKPIDHGTYRGARQHRYRGEPVCELCLPEEAAYTAERQRARRATARGDAG
ncbi:hypothetical protein [Streptomyces albipurpureus]|uniref:Uncharacterized protein n=1 Tax=Streptomyces albipurpureus TaxID=2897419 RepID=A0ABT0V0Q3_9ACTN|nr:hypothetical protein [Streptomyces sp. CWNU-1]MCM2394369.1 hypothetical protein [Streptomyces sp. CWNU-1]